MKKGAEQLKWDRVGKINKVVTPNWGERISAYEKASGKGDRETTIENFSNRSIRVSYLTRKN